MPPDSGNGTADEQQQAEGRVLQDADRTPDAEDRTRDAEGQMRDGRARTRASCR
jgi:hypothetical protein